MILIDKNRLLVEFDTHTSNFIDAANLTNDANLEVGGLYNAEQARMAIHVLVRGIKKIGIQSKIVALYPMVGGAQAQHELNLFEPSEHVLTFETGASGIPDHNGYGWKGGRAITDILHDSSFDDNLCLSVSLTEANTSNDSVEISSVFNGMNSNSSGATLSYRFDGNIALRGLGGTSEIFFYNQRNLGSVAVSYNGGTIATADGNEKAIWMKSDPVISTAEPNYFRIGEAEPNASNSNARRSFVGIFYYLTFLELKQLTFLMQAYQAHLNRKL